MLDNCFEIVGMVEEIQEYYLRGDRLLRLLVSQGVRDLKGGFSRETFETHVADCSTIDLVDSVVNRGQLVSVSGRITVGQKLVVESVRVLLV